MPTNNQEWDEKFRKEYPMVKDIDTNTIISRDTYDGGYRNGHIVGVGHGLMAGFKFSKSFIRQEIRKAKKELIKEILEEVVGSDRYNLITQKRRLTYSDVDGAYNQAKAEIKSRIAQIIK